MIHKDKEREMTTLLGMELKDFISIAIIALLTFFVGLISSLFFRKRKRANRETAKTRLRGLAETSTTSHLTIHELVVDVLSTINIDDSLRRDVADKIRKFNAQGNKIQETSYSAENKSSVHNLWRGILQLLAKKFGPSTQDPARIVYEWKIPNPFGNSTLGIDFAFLPLKMSSLSWLHLRGALEVKKTTWGKTSRARGNVVNRGRPQAINRAAMSVFESWKAANFTNAHSAFCCYADSCRFGVVRVRITENCEVFVEMSPLWDLPGSGRENESDEALRVLVHLLYSPAKLLAFQHLNSLPVSNVFPAAPHITGWSDEHQSQEIVWTLDSLLGSGGFGDVFLEQPPSKSVIKLVRVDRSHQDRSLLPIEYKILKRLGSDSASPQRWYPVLDGVMFNEDGNVKALKFSKRGIPLNMYLSCVGFGREKLLELVRTVGPELVQALKAAHSVCVIHGDLRPANVLLMPSEKILNGIVAFFDNIVIDGDATPMHDLDLRDPDFRVVLNDWGHAAVVREQKEASYSEELNELLKMLNSLEQFPYYASTISTHEEPSTPQKMKRGKFKIDDKNFALLRHLAEPENLNYDRMCDVLLSASLEEKRSNAE